MVQTPGFDDSSSDDSTTSSSGSSSDDRSDDNVIGTAPPPGPNENFGGGFAGGENNETASEPGGGTQDVASDPVRDSDGTGFVDSDDGDSSSSSSSSELSGSTADQTIVFEDEAENDQGQPVPGEVKGVVRDPVEQERVQRFAEQQARQEDRVERRIRRERRLSRSGGADMSTPRGPARVVREDEKEDLTTSRLIQQNTNDPLGLDRRNNNSLNNRDVIRSSSNRRLSSRPSSDNISLPFRLSEDERQALATQRNPARELSQANYDAFQREISQGEYYDAAVAGSRSLVYGLGSIPVGAKNLVENAKPTGKKLANVATRFDREIRSIPKEQRDEISVKPIGETQRRLVSSVAQSARENPIGFAGEAIGETAFGFGASKAARGSLQLARDTAVRTVGKRVDPDDVFTQDNTVADTDETLRRFRAQRNEDGDVVVQTSAPQRIKGDEAVEGSKPGLEDPGIYVTPRSEGNPLFLRVSDESQSATSVSLDPRNIFRVETPQVYEFEATDVRRLPEDVASQPGFEPVGRYFRQRDNTGEVFVTKRSEIGTGDRPAQEFTAERSVDKGDLQVSPGNKRVEAGTSELEGVVPESQGFERFDQGNIVQRLAGFNRYTEVNGRPVPLRRARLNRPSRADADTTTRANTDISSDDVRQGSAELSRVARRESTPETPSPIPSTSLEESPDVLSTVEDINSARDNTGSSSLEGLDRSGLPSSPSSDVSSFSSPSTPSSPSSLSDGSSGGSGPSSPNDPSSPSSPGSTGDTSSPGSPGGSSGGSGGVSGPGSGGGSAGSAGSPGTSSPPPLRRTDSQDGQEKFKVQIRREGEFRTIGETDDLTRARQLGRDRTEQTLAATYRVLQGDGDPVRLEPTGDYLLSESTPGGLVEKRDERLTTPSEVQEIQQENPRKRKQSKKSKQQKTKKRKQGSRGRSRGAKRTPSQSRGRAMKNVGVQRPTPQPIRGVFRGNPGRKQQKQRGQGQSPEDVLGDTQKQADNAAFGAEKTPSTNQGNQALADLAQNAKKTGIIPANPSQKAKPNTGLVKANQNTDLPFTDNTESDPTRIFNDL